MIDTIHRILDMPLKDDSESESNAVKNEDVHENDVLMGRGGKNNRHVGNEKLRDLAREQVGKYKVSTKKVKSAISRELVRKVRRMNPAGRFLRRVPETGDWEDVGDYLAREKVAQVLRDAVCETIDAARPSSHDARMVSSSTHYATYPGDRAAGVFRQSPSSEIEPLPLDEQARQSAIQGVVTASASSSFGHPPHFLMPYTPWNPYGHQQQQAYRGMPPPYPPVYQPTHPAHFMAPSTNTSSSYMPSPGTTVSQNEDPSSPSRQPPSAGNDPRSAFGPAYSISLSVATAPGAAPHGRTEAVMAWHHPSYATPMHGRERRKRSRSLPGERESSDKATQHEPERPSPKPNTSTKKSSATQTSTYDTGFGATGRAVVPVLPATLPPRPIWDQSAPPPPMMPFPAAIRQQSSQQAQVSYYEQHSHHQFARFEQPIYQQQQHQPPGRSYSAPLPHANSSQTLVQQDKDNDSSGHSIVERRRPAFSSRKIPRRIPEQPDDIIEPIPALPLQPAQPLQPPPARRHRAVGTSTTASSSSSSRRNSCQSQASAPDGGTAEGMEWFQGELLLESDEDDSENLDKAFPYPV